MAQHLVRDRAGVANDKVGGEVHTVGKDTGDGDGHDGPTRVGVGQEALVARHLVKERRADKDEEGRLWCLVVQQLEGIDAELILSCLDKQLIKGCGQETGSCPTGSSLRNKIYMEERGWYEYRL